MNKDLETRLAKWIVRFSRPLAVVALVVVAFAAAQGGGRVASFTAKIASLGDTSNGSGVLPPLIFDPRMDVWFGREDDAVQTYREIEERFVAEDYIMVSFEVPPGGIGGTGDLGVFEPENLATIARLTEAFLRVPGVRHVRSLTSNPWIRYGEIEDSGGEQGLLISDLVEGDPGALTRDELIERMVAVLGAERVAERLGEERVRAVLGDEADFDDFIGEPLLLGTILDETGSTTAIQIQVLRPLVDQEALAAAFPEGPGGGAEQRGVASSLYSIQAQRASLRGIEHFLRVERGLAVPTPEHAELTAWVESLPVGEEREALRLELLDPNRNFMAGPDGELVRKYFEYAPDGPEGSGGYVDRSDPTQPVAAPADFQPTPLSAHTFHVGGVPLFERNFEDVGMEDAKYMGLMFVAIALLLTLIFRRVVGVVAPFAVVLGSVAAMVGVSFALGDLFNNMTIIAPNMLTAVGMADAVHLVASWALLRPRIADRRELIEEVVRRNLLPVFLTSVTTAVGFYSLTISEMVPVSQLGAMTGFGTIMAYLLSMTVVPALLSLVPHPEPSPEALANENARRGSRSGWEARLTGFVFRNRGRIVVGAVGLTLVSLLSIGGLRIDSDFRAMFPDDNPVMSDFQWIEDRMGGVGDFEIVFDGLPPAEAELAREERQRLAELRLRSMGRAEGFEEFAPLEPAEAAELADLDARERAVEAARVGVSGAFLSELDRFETRLRGEMADPESPLRVLTDFASPLDILRRMHQVQNRNRAAFYRVPGEEDVPAELRRESLSFDEWTEEWLHVPAQSASTLVAQYYLQYENGARPGENLATQLSMDRTRFRMQGRVVQAPSELIVGAARRVQEIARTEFPTLGARFTGVSSASDAEPVLASGTEGPELAVSGKMLLFARTTRIFTLGFIQSMSIALVIITLLIGFIFRSARVALVSMIPNVLPILVPLSVFGLLGRTLDAPAIFVSSVALGVCVDDTIHFFTKFMAARRRGESVEDAVRYTFETTGMAITVTTLVLIFGFGMLILSDFAPNVMMGSLAAIMIALAWVADLLVTPAVLSYVDTDIAGASDSERA